jgi:hypothetical protein
MVTSHPLLEVATLRTQYSFETLVEEPQAEFPQLKRLSTLLPAVRASGKANATARRGKHPSATEMP